MYSVPDVSFAVNDALIIVGEGIGVGVGEAVGTGVGVGVGFGVKGVPDIAFVLFTHMPAATTPPINIDDKATTINAALSFGLRFI